MCYTSGYLMSSPFVFVCLPSLTQRQRKPAERNLLKGENAVPTRKRNRSQFRIFAALTALCYLFVGVTLSFQHVHLLLPETETALHLPVSTTVSFHAVTHTRLAASNSSAHKPHTCAACEWQSNNISPALPAVTLVFLPLTHQRVITTFPRYLPVRTISTSSRAPPLA